MSELFTGKAISKSVSLPEGMWAYFGRRRTKIGIPVSRQIQDLIELGLSRQDHTLIDTPAPYRTEPVAEEA